MAVGLLLLLRGTLPSHAASTEGVPDAIRFNRDIRPILSEKCYACHGPDKNKRKAGLRLDTQAGLFEGKEGAAPVVPGKPDQSELVRRITTQDRDDRMPLPASGKTLTVAQIARLKRWIEQGAPWEGHWAYQPPLRPPVPPVQTASWPLNPIDHFILARLDAEGLTPSVEADRRILLRRLSFDLTGLPSTPEEFAAFANDPSPHRYEQFVDRLLASPHYGERLAAYWLDLVRYADTDGYHGDNYRSVYPYRDYVIQAFNGNLPFDRFTREQLAGDLLPNAAVTQKTASTYNRLGRTTEEGGAQPKEFLAKYAADRVRSTATAWLGSTLACAECHDHKFDPFTTKDFYRFAAFFADVKEQGVARPEPVPVPDAQAEAELARREQAIQILTRKLETPTDELAEAQGRWEAETLAARDEGRLGWQVIKPTEVRSEHGATLTVLDDRSVLASGANPAKDTYTVTLSPDPQPVTALRLETLTHPTLANQSLSRANGNFVLTGVEVEASPGSNAPFQRIKLASARADFSQPGYDIAGAIDDQPETGWAVDGHNKAADHRAMFAFAQPIPGGPGTTLRIRLKHESQFAQHNIGRFRLAVTSAEHPSLGPDGLPDDLVAALRLPKAQRSPEQAMALARHYRAVAPELNPVRAELTTARQKKDDFVKSLPTTLATVTVEPRVMRVLPRGNWLDDSGDVVTPGVPEFLVSAAATDRRATRLDLADWILSRQNPLTARVFVNRLWKLFFGTGISRVLDDVGAQGEWPMHPELLDWLAVEFMDSGWDVKHLVRLMVTSSAYRQSSRMADSLRDRDPNNRLLARQSRFRMDAEMVRDGALAVSGLLVPKLGGPSVKPYQPPGYWAQLNFPKREWEHDHGDALYRRTLYTFWCRAFLHPTLVAFDAPSREECTAERAKSNTPQQALALLNDPIFVEAARVLGERIVRQGGATPEQRLEWAFQRALTRSPSAEEQRVLIELLQKERARYDANRAAAKDLVSVGEWPVAQDLDLPELASWTSVARVVLNLHETTARF